MSPELAVEASRAYFRERAASYDEVDKQHFWRLSDSLLWELLCEHVLSHVPPKFTVCDAGAGTGRWICRIAKEFPEARGVAIDASADMLSVLRAKVSATPLMDRIDIIEHDLISTPLPVNPCDVVLCLHNVFGFIHDVGALVASLKMLANPGGKIALVSPNLFHGVYFALKTGDLTEALSISRASVGRFHPTMPPIRFAMPREVLDLGSAAGLKPLAQYGFPVCTYPDLEETTLRANSEFATDLLSDAERYTALLEIERVAVNHSTPDRGNNVLTIFEKE